MKYFFTLLMFTLATNCFADSLLSSNSDGADGVIGGHEYVDLGLPSGTLWATYNVGATSPYERVITLHGEKWSHVKISHGKTTSSLKGMK